MCTSDFITQESKRFKKFLVLKNYKDRVINNYVNRNSKFLHSIPHEFNMNTIREYIEKYIATIPLNAKMPTSAALHAYYSFKTNLVYKLKIRATDFKYNANVENELIAFNNYLTNFKHLSPNTIHSTIGTARIFLLSIFNENCFSINILNANIVRDFISITLNHLSPASKKTIIVRIRNFFHYLENEYNFNAKEILTLPMTTPVWSLNKLPKFIDDTDVIKLEDSYKNCKNKKRDYAIFRCLKDLGIRCSEVANISLSNFDWNNSSLEIVACKSKLTRILPLPEITGSTISEYIFHERPKSKSKILFLRSKSERGEPMGTSQIRATIRRAAIRANIKNFKGTHSLRHLAGKNMINADIDIKVIADILGHESIETTMIYTKVDIKGLRNVTTTWPEVGKC